MVISLSHDIAKTIKTKRQQDRVCNSTSARQMASWRREALVWCLLALVSARQLIVPEYLSAEQLLTLSWRLAAALAAGWLLSQALALYFVPTNRVRVSTSHCTTFSSAHLHNDTVMFAVQVKDRSVRGCSSPDRMLCRPRSVRRRRKHSGRRR